MTLPWLDNSKRILPTARFQDYMDSVRQRRAERESLVGEFINRYEHWVNEAAAMRGSTFRSADYPDRTTAAARFDFKVEAEPVPHKDDFRVTLTATDLGEMQSVLEERLATAARIARNALIPRTVPGRPSRLLRLLSNATRVRTRPSTSPTRSWNRSPPSKANANKSP